MASRVSNCYTVLGLNFGASDGEIKTAFKQQARLWHPDKCSDRGAADKFRAIRAAYEILSSPQKKQQHDASLARARRGGLGSRGSGPIYSFFRATTFQEPPAASPTATSSSSGPQTAFADLLSALANAATPVSELRSLAQKCFLSWPRDALDRDELRRNLSKAADEALHKMVLEGQWEKLTVKDIVHWLDLHGCCLKYALECDTVTKDQVVHLARGLVSRGVPRGPVASRPTTTTTSQQQQQQQQQPLGRTFSDPASSAASPFLGGQASRNPTGSAGAAPVTAATTAATAAA
eukprot:CAMPEP_0206460898 /NCGR_PEP_ID=MMETSP0324_2-20121206/25012_1 /ASSEMBLY_ACC=CAM_ASM_000836 /TAXON_ID=2866 /ORGANISM="Crypthecodinium cohnii, Strain Seligo" /LENGTH=291 /DNA_ID=CAMNT_0053932661 /DNA_START=27 /DNA_END=898 /DNA_ORIENTATION=+